MVKHISLKKELPEEGALSYDFLRAEGLRTLQALAGDVWTDYNDHDPGVTLLEQLCYAMTDVAYRIDLDMGDLLAYEKGRSFEYRYGPTEILTTNPVTLIDIRKVVIDVIGVKNAWVEKVRQPQPPLYYHTDDCSLHLLDADNSEPVVVKGLYRIIFEKEEFSQQTGPELLAKVKNRLHACRGLCEDFEEIQLLDAEAVQLHGSVMIGHVEDVELLVARVMYRLALFLSPRMRFYTMPELLKKGRRVDEIFDGPELAHGFIDDQELMLHDRKTTVQVSGLIHEIMKEEGIVVVNELRVSTGSSQSHEEWMLQLDSSKVPKLDFRGTSKSLSFQKKGLLVTVDWQRVQQLYQEMLMQDKAMPLDPAFRDILMPEPENWQLANYYSIQNHLPITYGIGQHGLPDSASRERREEAEHLKAYLVFFEQFLADYHAQLDHFKDLLGFETLQGRSYFKQTLKGVVPNFEKVLVTENAYESYLEEDEEEAPRTRRNQFLNHLLAIFGENFHSYATLHPNFTKDKQLAPLDLIEDKSLFLKEYPDLSRDRGRAFDYSQDSWDTYNVSGLTKRIARKLGIRDYTCRDLSNTKTEGFHLIEHVLLRPHLQDFFQYTDGLTARTIDHFEAGRAEGWTRCNTTDHCLQAGDLITIKGADAYAGKHEAHPTGLDSFEINCPFVGIPSEKVIWRHAGLDTRYLVLTHLIQGVEESEVFDHTTCKAPDHQLEENEMVRIVGDPKYEGVHQVTNLTRDTFDIPIRFQPGENQIRWVLENVMKDPYSLQMTLVFPNWVGRFQNDAFRQFTEKMVRQETPAHLTVYVQWVGADEMAVFEEAFQDFLAALKTR